MNIEIIGVETRDITKCTPGYYIVAGEKHMVYIKTLGGIWYYFTEEDGFKEFSVYKNEVIFAGYPLA